MQQCTSPAHAGYLNPHRAERAGWKSLTSHIDMDLGEHINIWTTFMELLLFWVRGKIFRVGSSRTEETESDKSRRSTLCCWRREPNQQPLKINTEFLKAVVTGRVARLFLHLCVFGECTSTSPEPGVPSPRNNSKIATANQTECKSALWKEL